MDGPLVASMPRRAAAHRGRQTSSQCIVPDRLRRWHHSWMTLTLSHLRRYAVARSLFKPTSLLRALDTLGFVQADPIRAPARAQDLTLRHRVSGYRAGEFQQRYRQLPLEEAFFVNYVLCRAWCMPCCSGVSRARCGRRNSRRWRRMCWPMSPSMAWCIRGRWQPILPRARCAPGLAPARMPAPSCSMACITAACCGWPGARAAPGCMPWRHLRRPISRRWKPRWRNWCA